MKAKRITLEALQQLKLLVDDYELNTVPVVSCGTVIAVHNSVYPSSDVVCFSKLRELPIA